MRRRRSRDPVVADRREEEAPCPDGKGARGLWCAARGAGPAPVLAALFTVGRGGMGGRAACGRAALPAVAAGARVGRRRSRGRQCCVRPAAPTRAPDLLPRGDGDSSDPLRGPRSVSFRPFLRGPTRACPAFSARGPRSLRGRSGSRTAPRAERAAAAVAGLLPPHAPNRPAGSGRPPGQRGRAAAGQLPPQGMAGLGAGQAGREWRDGTGRVARSRALFPAPPRLGVPGGSGGESASRRLVRRAVRASSDAPGAARAALRAAGPLPRLRVKLGRLERQTRRRVCAQCAAPR